MQGFDEGMSDFAERLRLLREERGCTQKEIAQLVGKVESSVRMWELRKSRPDNQALVVLANFFGVSVDYLLGRESARQHDVPQEVTLIARRVGEMGGDEQKAMYNIINNTIDLFLSTRNKEEETPSP